MSAENPNTGIAISSWGLDGIATVEVTGGDRRAVLEAALRAILTLAESASLEPKASQEVRSAPIRGEGDDLALLFSDLIDDLLDQADYFGAGLQDVTLDGLVRRDDGGFVAWGYASGMPARGEGLANLTLSGMPTVREDAEGGIAIRASFMRSNPSPPTPLPLR